MRSLSGRLLCLLALSLWPAPAPGEQAYGKGPEPWRMEGDRGRANELYFGFGRSVDVHGTHATTDAATVFYRRAFGLGGHGEHSPELAARYFQGEEPSYGLEADYTLRLFLGNRFSSCPFAGLGFGVIYTDLQVEELDRRLNVTPQVSFGVRWQTGSRQVTAEARVFHISNADTAGRNLGLNMVLFLFGASF